MDFIPEKNAKIRLLEILERGNSFDFRPSRLMSLDMFRDTVIKSETTCY